jgi:PTH1 family peptidyl-tRNA hydrolase
MRLIVGLGNPGRIYKYSRHNIGFLLIDRLTKRWGIKIKPDLTTRSCVGRGSIEDREVILAYPLCFMNLVGHSIKLLLMKYDLKPQEDMLIACDDLDLEWGKIRIRPRGSSGGHKGVESIIKALGGSDFARLRIGIGRPRHKKEVVDYVLNSWTRNEKKQLNGYLERAADCCETWIVGGINQAMNKFNPRAN